MKNKICFQLSLAFILLLPVLAACRAANQALIGEWTLVKLNGKNVLPGVDVRLAFDEETVSGFGGCNSFSGVAKISGKNLQFSDLGMTLMACLDDSINQQETEFFIALNRVTTWEVDGNLLRLSGEDVMLEFDRRTSETGAPLASAWLLDEVNGKAPYAGTQFNLTFDPAGTITGFSGCATYYGSYRAENGVITFSDLAMTAMTCTDGAIAEAERTYFQNLQQVNGYAIEDNRLTLSGTGVSLVYKRIQIAP